MAILTAVELARLRQFLREQNPDIVIDFTKTEINDTLQAAEDWFETNRASFSTAMQNGTAHIWTNAELKAIGAAYLLQKANRERA